MERDRAAASAAHRSARQPRAPALLAWPPPQQARAPPERIASLKATRAQPGQGMPAFAGKRLAVRRAFAVKRLAVRRAPAAPERSSPWLPKERKTPPTARPNFTLSTIISSADAGIISGQIHSYIAPDQCLRRLSIRTDVQLCAVRTFAAGPIRQRMDGMLAARRTRRPRPVPVNCGVFCRPADKQKPAGGGPAGSQCGKVGRRGPCRNSFGFRAPWLQRPGCRRGRSPDR